MILTTPSASGLLDAWERGEAKRPVWRALSLLWAAWPPGAAPPPETLSIGRRDALLLELRRRLFGPKIMGVTNCPACAQRVEVALEADDIRIAGHRADADADGDSNGAGDARPEEFFLSDGPHQVRFRLPNSGDLQEAAAVGDPDAARRLLLERCVLEATCDGRELKAEDMPPDLTDHLARRMGEADAQADVWLLLACPECKGKWQARFDIAAFLWEEVAAWAGGMLRDVARLAAAFGWSEGEILAMTPRRRRAYLRVLDEWPTT
jgi:hypothetical protein